MWIFCTVVFVYSFTVYGQEECASGQYGDDCNQNCSQNCFVLPNTTLHCNKDNGKCSEGCIVGVFGDRCNEPCSRNCKEHICNQHNGHCTWGCIGNHIGDFCELALAGTSNDGQSNVTSRVEPTKVSILDNHAIKVIVPVAVTVLISVGIVCTVNLLRRCHKRGQHHPEDGKRLLPVSATHLDHNRREDTILHIACREGTLAQVRQILSEGRVDINGRGNCGWTPVMTAAKSGRRELVDLLVRKHCDLSLTDNDGNTILHVACVEGHVKIVRCVLSKKEVDVNSPGHCNRTPVMAAARFGQKKVFDLLVKNGSHLTTVDTDGNNILHIACIGGHMGIVKYILNHERVDINSIGHNGMTPLMFAIHYGNMEVFELLVRRECFLRIVDKTGKNILHMASANGNVDMVEHILKKDIVSVESKDETGKTPVMFAVQFGHTQVFKLLVNSKYHLQDVYEDGNNILHVSCARGHFDIAQCILTWDNIDIDCFGHNGMTPLMFAVKNGHTLIFDLLVSGGCDMTPVDKDGNTVLHMACIGGNEHVVEDILSKHSVDINGRGQSQRTPVMVAAAEGHYGVIDLLANRGADLSLVDSDGCNILHLVCMGGDLQMVQHVQNIMGCMK